MAWVNIGGTNLIDGAGTHVGYVWMDYDNGSGTTTRHVRVTVSGRAGYWFSVKFNNFAIDGQAVGNLGEKTQNSGTIWDGWLSGNATHTASWYNPWNNGGRNQSVGGYVPTGATYPVISSVTLDEIGTDYAKISATLSSYGSPVANDSYMEVAILGSSAYGSPYRYVHSANKATSMTPTRVDNSSTTGSSALTIKPNTKYWYGAYATNRAVYTTKVQGSFITKPLPTSNAVARNDGGNITITWSIPSGQEGTASTITTQGSIDGGQTWQTITSPWTFYQEDGGEHTALIRRVGASTSETISVPYISEVSKLYYGNGNKAVLMRKVYIGDSTNKAREMKKVYIGDENNRARKVLG